jgi:adenine phosphoribosyltransferase
MAIAQALKSLIRAVPNFPKPGIIFQDITPLLGNPLARRQVVELVAGHYRDQRIDALAAVEARGFIFGTLIAQELGIPFIPVRKSGRLPYKKIHQDYSLEYGTATIEMHSDAIRKGWRVLVHDDLLATGGTSAAAAAMIQQLHGEIAGFSFIINLAFLPGEKFLTERFDVKPHYVLNFT